MKKKWFYPLLITTTIGSALVHFFTKVEWIQFTLACTSLLFWAALLGKATESVAHYAGERLGGLLNATFGNAAELIISIFLVKAGLFNLVKASIIGSIIGNLLLVLGLSVFFGGLKYKTQQFNPILAGHNASLMMIAVIGLFIPATFLQGVPHTSVFNVSMIIAAVLIIGYFLWLYFSLVTHRKELSEQETEANPTDHDEDEGPAWSKWVSIFMLALSTIFVAIQSEWIVATVEYVAHVLGWSELFVGAFLIAIIGNAAEHSAAVFLAMKNRIGAAVEIAIGSSLQISLFVAPVLVFIGLLFGQHMNLIFNHYEIAAVAVATFIASSISRDGSTNWYEGVLLLMVYIILGAAFFVVR
ncbi:calcium/proton exchanger [Thermoflavimicrobium dichotomicum]|uniref:Ca(2+)/H(+) antiporter n=1 Tax=Thermoflavimicrobium dichotomicum TaxID=46223 RepID=A0A1I3MNZ6_9BACL|nr:calcium/proton exchanger [Thermoflavimicrobium dichotomicum]SFI98520.1 Ca2+:H+ antiporter [Thermoflavimicrobium dichotomicum]